jgi:rhodanese-related sulfurtransferase
MSQSITVSELKSKIDQRAPFVLVEALPEPYYRKGHLPGARLMPHTEVAALAPSLIADKTTDVVVYCANSACKNSDQAAEQLRELGYQNVRVYVGGKADWQEAGFELER